MFIRCLKTVKPPRVHETSLRFNEKSPRFNEKPPRVHEKSPRVHEKVPARAWSCMTCFLWCV